MKIKSAQLFLVILFLMFSVNPVFSEGIELIIFPSGFDNLNFLNISEKDAEIIKKVENIYMKINGIDMNSLMNPVIKIKSDLNFEDIIKVSGIPFEKKNKRLYIWKFYGMMRSSKKDIILSSLTNLKKINRKKLNSKIRLNTANNKYIEKTTNLFGEFKFKKIKDLKIKNDLLRFIFEIGNFKIVSSDTGLKIIIPENNEKLKSELVIKISESIKKMKKIIEEGIKNKNVSPQYSFILENIARTFNTVMTIPHENEIHVNMFYPERINRLLGKYGKLKNPSMDKPVKSESIHDKKICMANIKLIMIALKLRFMQKKFKNEMKSIEQLIDEDYLKLPPVCPEHGKYFIHNTGNEIIVNCSHHMFK